MNSLAVEPGSKGSVKVEARDRDNRRPPACREASASSSPLVGIEEDDVAALGLHLGQRIVQSPLRDLLQLRVDREHDVVARHRLPDHSAGES